MSDEILLAIDQAASRINAKPLSYFSATKVAWILNRDPDTRAAAWAGHLAFGTVDSFLIWRLGGRLHVTDAYPAAESLGVHRIRRRVPGGPGARRLSLAR